MTGWDTGIVWSHPSTVVSQLVFSLILIIHCIVIEHYSCHANYNPSHTNTH